MKHRFLLGADKNEWLQYTQFIYKGKGNVTYCILLCEY